MITFESMNEYQSQAASGENPHGYLSSHSLGKFSESPRAWKNAKPETGTNNAYTFGTAWHTLAAEGLQEYMERHPIGEAPPVNKTTGKPYGTASKAYKEWAADQPEGVVTADEDAKLHRMLSNLQENELAVQLMDEKCIAEAIMRGTCQGVAIQGRFDLWRGDGNDFVDLKTTRSLDTFREDFFKFNYDKQLAFYMLLARANGYSPSGASVIATEKTGSLRTAVYTVSLDTLETAMESVQVAIRQFAACRSRGHFPAQVQYHALEI